ncbi:MAG: 4Fe-4S dicluster domain-containing protein [Tannerellaceae bacterium]|nr:4Fe-4S dicluster domain-containing protein [Tannerellaceae bacterium]
MIRIKDKKDCCGCYACAQRCPRECITMQEDKEGFPYPVVDITSCIDCGLCEKVCPVLHPGIERKPLYTYAAKNKDTHTRMQSSSGGIFTLLAEQIINEKGVVFGAAYNARYEVGHTYTETIEGIHRFRGSKYVQSSTNDTFRKVEEFLQTRTESTLLRYSMPDSRAKTVFAERIPRPTHHRFYLSRCTQP